MFSISESNTCTNFTLFLLLIWMTVAARLSAQHALNSHTRTAVIDIIPDSSSLMINGSTNVNSFDCTFTGNIRNDSLLVELVPGDTATTLRGAHLKLRVRHFDCGRSKMNTDFYDLMKADETPHIYMDVARFWQAKRTRNADSLSSQAYHAETVFTLAGATNQYLVDIGTRQNTANNSEETPTVIKGQHKLDITDFGLEPPSKFLGLVKVDKSVTISFKIVMRYHFKTTRQVHSGPN